MVRREGHDGYWNMLRALHIMHIMQIINLALVDLDLLQASQYSSSVGMSSTSAAATW
jgi:hypothetical protein